MVPAFFPNNSGGGHGGGGRDHSDDSEICEIRKCKKDCDCKDDNPCTIDTCDKEECVFTPIPGCASCNDAGDCNDLNVCTNKACVEGVCEITPISGCATCNDVNDCNDHNVCTNKACVAGLCQITPIPGCGTCTTALDCNDIDGCTTDSCIAGRCSYAPIIGCTNCLTVSDCPVVTCETASCSATNVCEYTPIPGCPFVLLIAVTPANFAIGIGANQQFTATGFFSDGSIQDITSQVVWASTFPAVASISPDGLALGVIFGITTITATLNAVTGSTNLTVGCVDVPADIAGWWPGDLNAFDITPAANNGTFNGTYVPGQVAEAFNFPGDPTVFVSIPSSAALEPSTTITVDAWIKAGPQGNFKYLVSKGFDTPPTGCSEGSSYALNTNSTGNLVFVVASAANTFHASQQAPLTIWDGDWHFVAGTYDGNTVRLYVDGNEVLPATPAVGGLNIFYGYSDHSLTFGTFRGCPTLPPAYSGSLDEVEIFQRVLTLAEIQSIHNASNAGKCKPVPPAIFTWNDWLLVNTLAPENMTPVAQP